MQQPKTARDVLESRGKLERNVVAVQAAGRVWDLHTPLSAELAEGPLQPIRRGDPAALEILRHSAAHVMADAVQRLFPGTQVTIGPAVDDGVNGFYYDFDRPEGPFSDADLERIEAEMKKTIERNDAFRREEVSRDRAAEIFRSMGETYKLEILAAIPAGESISLYRHGEWMDLCQGPHVPSTGAIGAVKLLSVAGAYWRGNVKNKMLQRIYGTAFATEKLLKAQLVRIQEALARDHRKLGRELNLFSFQPLAPASPFFHPRGARVYGKLTDFLRGLYRIHGYEEVITPQIYDVELYKRSGHYENYLDNMYFSKVQDREYSVKPMNCPGHCVLFAETRRSYRELPYRMADFGRLHRLELSGVVHGLTRTRTFVQDDAHIFCTPGQAGGEIERFMTLCLSLYRVFGFGDVEIRVATRPPQRIGTDAMWDEGEKLLMDTLAAKSLAFGLSPGEGAFYGPKIELHVKDAIGRSWQLGTIQVDTMMPERFELSYIGDDGGKHRPVMLHRAMLGSFERFLGVLIEHTAGAFPIWCAPEAVAVLPVADAQNPYAEKIEQTLHREGIDTFRAGWNQSLGAKIREATLMKVPVLAVVGGREEEQGTVAPRLRAGEKKDAMPIEAFVKWVVGEARFPEVIP